MEGNTPSRTSADGNQKVSKTTERKQHPLQDDTNTNQRLQTCQVLLSTDHRELQEKNIQVENVRTTSSFPHRDRQMTPGKDICRRTFALGKRCVSGQKIVFLSLEATECKDDKAFKRILLFFGTFGWLKQAAGNRCALSRNNVNKRNHKRGQDPRGPSGKVNLVALCMTSLFVLLRFLSSAGCMTTDSGSLVSGGIHRSAMASTRAEAGGSPLRCRPSAPSPPRLAARAMVSAAVAA